MSAVMWQSANIIQPHIKIMSIKNLNGLKKNTALQLREGGTVFFRGLEGTGRTSRVKVAATETAKKTETVALQKIVGLA